MYLTAIQAWSGWYHIYPQLYFWLTIVPTPLCSGINPPAGITNEIEVFVSIAAYATSIGQPMQPNLSGIGAKATATPLRVAPTTGTDADIIICEIKAS